MNPVLAGAIYEAFRADGSLASEGGHQMIGDSARLEHLEPEPLDALAGERKFVTVMFVDIARSGRFVAGRDPEEADDRLLPLLQMMIDAVQQFGGTVNQVMGDGIMAIFGVPLAQENHGLRACMAADAIRQRLESLNESASKSCETGMRVGLSSGEVVVKEGGGEFGLNYRVLGEAVYLARRLENAAPINRVLISGETFRLVSGAISAFPHGEVRIEEGAEGVQAYLLDEINLDHRASGRRFSDVEPMFIGRGQYLDTLNRLWEQVVGGRGRSLAITGEAGIGKSRLLSEFLAFVPDRETTVITCEILPVGLTQPLEASAKILRALLSTHLDLRETPTAELLEPVLAKLGIQGRFSVAATLQVLSGQQVDDAWLGLEPAHRQQIIVETVGDLVATACQSSPLIIIFEDFHWADSETHPLVNELAHRVPSSSLFLVLTSRARDGHVWSKWPASQEVELRPFSWAQTSALLEVLLGGAPALDELKQLLASKTEGNPFFLGECVRALEDSGSLVRHGSGYDLAVPISELEIPGTVSGVLAARIDSLPAEDRSILVCASVIGPRVDFGLIRELCPKDKDDLLACLTRLQQAGFLERTRIVPNLEYSFRHALIHEVAYGTVLKSKRRHLHLRVLTAIEKRSNRQLHGRTDLLAHHAFLAESWPKAFVYCRKAGQRAQSRSANREAASFYRRALEAREQLPGSARIHAREIDTRLEYVQTLFTLSQQDLAQRQLLRAQKLAEETGNQRRLTKVASAFMGCHWVKADLEGAILKGEEALELARRLDDPTSQIEVGTRLGSVYIDRGDYQAACELLGSTIGNISRRDLFDRFGLLVIASVGSRTSLARAKGELGLFDEAIRVGDEGIMIAEEAGHVFSQIYAYLFVGNALLRKGDFERSLPPLVRSFELCTSTRGELLFPLSAATLGYSKVRLGDVSEGLALLQKATAAAERQSIKFQLSQELTWLSEALLIAGQYDQARLHAKNALYSAQRHGEIGDEAWALWLLGEVFSHRVCFDPKQAESAYLRAQEIAECRQMRPLAAHIYFGLGRLYRNRQSWHQADQNLIAAESAYRQLDMNYWLPLVQKERVWHEEKLAVNSTTA